MKLIQYDDEYIMFLNKLYIGGIEFNDNKEVMDYVRDILKKLNNYYNIKLKGFYKVYVYLNKLYGIIMEVIKIDNYDEYNNDSVDLKIVINNDTDIYLKTSNYEVIKEVSEFYFKNGFYYINLEDILDSFNKYIEFFDIIYKDIDKILIGAKIIRRN